jgi:hypothetical protein
MIFAGLRFAELIRMAWNTWVRTVQFHEFILLVKNQQKLQRVRLFRLPNSPLDPYRALNDVLVQETEKQQRLFGRSTPTGPIWTDGDSKPWDSATASAAVSRVLRLAGLPYNRPYRVKAWTVTALRKANVPLVDIAKFIRHNVASGNLDRFYVVDDKGKSCAEKLDELAAAAHN